MLAHAWVSAGARGCPQSPNFDHAAVSQEGGCQLNHLRGDVIHPCNVPTQHKINPEACILPRPRGTCHVTCLSVYSSGGLQPRIQLFRGVYRYTALSLRPAPLAEVYSSTAVYSIQLYSGLQYTAVYIPPQETTEATDGTARMSPQPLLKRI